MTIKSALTVIALAAGLVAGPALAQAPATIGGITVPEADVGAVQARCDVLKNNAETESLVTTSDSEADNDDQENESVAGDAGVVNEPAADGATAITVDLDAITRADCEADGWFDM